MRDNLAAGQEQFSYRASDNLAADFVGNLAARLRLAKLKFKSQHSILITQHLKKPLPVQRFLCLRQVHSSCVGAAFFCSKYARKMRFREFSHVRRDLKYAFTRSINETLTSGSVAASQW